MKTASSSLFFFNDTATTEIYTLSLHDALPIFGVGDTGEAAYSTFFTVPGATEVARLVFTYAWHLARAHGAAARLLLGMSAPCAALIAHLSLRQIHSLAQTHQAWLRPRWPARVQVWRELLLAAASGEAPVLERARLHRSEERRVGKEGRSRWSPDH